MKSAFADFATSVLAFVAGGLVAEILIQREERKAASNADPAPATPTSRIDLPEMRLPRP